MSFTLCAFIGKEQRAGKTSDRILYVHAFYGGPRGPCLQFDVNGAEHTTLDREAVQLLVERLNRWLMRPTFEGCRRDVDPLCENCRHPFSAHDRAGCCPVPR